VDEGFRGRFEAADAENGGFFTDGRPGHAWFDLEGYCLKRLADSGIVRAEGLGADTKADPVRFFSYRRKTLAGEPDYGRQLSLIALSG
jgi:copper oxidase (laccase) domain-containing protein